MSRFARFIGLIVGTLWAVSVAAPQDVDDQARRNELKQLQGTWVIQSATRDGKERKEETGAVLSIAGDQLRIRLSNSTVSMYMEFDVQDLTSKPKHVSFRPDQNPDSPAALKIAIDDYGTAGYQIDGDTLKLCFRASQVWPPEISDKKQVLWILRRETAVYRKEKLDQRLLGKQIVRCEVIAKSDDKRDKDVEFPEITYLGCKDLHDYFLEPFVATPSPFTNGPFPKFTKVLHGLRVVQGLKGEMVLIENWYAGFLHGQQVRFQDGRRWYETTYQYGVRHGIARHYQGNEIWNEENYVEGRKVSARYFHSNGQPSDFWVENVLREERDEKGKLIPTRKIEMQKLHGVWEIVAATKDGKARDGEKGGELTFFEDDVRVKLPGKKGTMTMNAHLRRPGTLPYIDFHAMVLERRFGCPLDECRGGRYVVDGNSLRIAFRSGEDWPKDLSDMGQVLWVLDKKKVK